MTTQLQKLWVLYTYWFIAELFLDLYPTTDLVWPFWLECRLVPSLGHQGGEEFSEGAQVLNYVQSFQIVSNILFQVGKNFSRWQNFFQGGLTPLQPHVTGLQGNKMLWQFTTLILLLQVTPCLSSCDCHSTSYGLTTEASKLCWSINCCSL